LTEGCKRRRAWARGARHKNSVALTFWSIDSNILLALDVPRLKYSDPPHSLPSNWRPPPRVFAPGRRSAGLGLLGGQGLLLPVFRPLPPTRLAWPPGPPPSRRGQHARWCSWATPAPCTFQHFHIILRGIGPSSPITATASSRTYGQVTKPRS